MRRVYTSAGEGVEGRALKRMDRQIARYQKESRFLFKDRSLMDAREEVFDEPTLMTLYGLMNHGVFAYLNGVVNAGKESRVYWGVTRDESDVAVKIHLVSTAGFKRRLPYIIGDPRFGRVRKGTANLVSLWTGKEFVNLKTAYRAGVSVPKPIVARRNVIVMDFVGSNGNPASLLTEVEVTLRDYKRVIGLLKKLYSKARLVHADLSEYNVFKNKGRLIVFDMGSAVDVGHPNAVEFLRRDLLNLNQFFARRGIMVDQVDKVLEGLIGH